MNLVSLADAVFDRLNGDSTLLGLVTGGIRHWYNKSDQPENSQTPYGVITVDIGAHEHSTRGEIWDLDVTVTIHVPRTTTLQTAEDAVTRIHGDATTRADLTPSIGLHRWTPSLSGSWTAGVMVCVDGSTFSDNVDWFTTSLVYRCRLSREAPTS